MKETDSRSPFRLPKKINAESIYYLTDNTLSKHTGPLRETRCFTKLSMIHLPRGAIDTKTLEDQHTELEEKYEEEEEKVE